MKKTVKVKAEIDGIEILAVSISLVQLVKHPKVTGEMLMDWMIEGLEKNFIPKT